MNYHGGGTRVGPMGGRGRFCVFACVFMCVHVCVCMCVCMVVRPCVISCVLRLQSPGGRERETDRMRESARARETSWIQRRSLMKVLCASGTAACVVESTLS